MINPYSFSIELFRTYFPELSGIPDEKIAFSQELGPEYLGITRYWGDRPLAQQERIAMLVVAHLSTLASNGSTAPAGPVTGATEGSVSVSFSAAAGSSLSSSFWGLTGYGQQVWLLLRRFLTPHMVSGTGEVLC